jgi:hypothetical protein
MRDRAVAHQMDSMKAVQFWISSGRSMDLKRMSSLVSSTMGCTRRGSFHVQGCMVVLAGA